MKRAGKAPAWARQCVLPGVDVAARKRGRAERGPTARKQWEAFKRLTRTQAGSPFWVELLKTGMRRRWWTLTDVRCLARAYKVTL